MLMPHKSLPKKNTINSNTKNQIFQKYNPQITSDLQRSKNFSQKPNKWSCLINSKVLHCPNSSDHPR